MKHTISSAHINKNKLSEIAFQVTELELSEDAKQRILKGRKYLDEKYGAMQALLHTVSILGLVPYVTLALNCKI